MLLFCACCLFPPFSSSLPAPPLAAAAVSHSLCLPVMVAVGQRRGRKSEEFRRIKSKQLSLGGGRGRFSETGNVRGQQTYGDPRTSI